MENSNGTTKNNLQIIKHPTYRPYPCTNPLLSWFDIRVFYVRICNLMVDGYTPDYLTLSNIPLDPDTILEVNNKRCNLESPGSFCQLKRNRVDKKSEEATFVSTDSIWLSGSVKFEVFDDEDLIFSGVLEMDKNSNGFVGKSKNNDVERWSMKCESMIGANSRVLKGEYVMSSDFMPPMIEVYVAGSFLGGPVILTKTLQISLGMKQERIQSQRVIRMNLREICRLVFIFRGLSGSSVSASGRGMIVYHADGSGYRLLSSLIKNSSIERFIR